MFVFQNHFNDVIYFHDSLRVEIKYIYMQLKISFSCKFKCKIQSDFFKLMFWDHEVVCRFIYHYCLSLHFVISDIMIANVLSHAF